MEEIKHFARTVLEHRYTSMVVGFIGAAIITGMACVYFMRLFDFVIAHRLDFHSIGNWCWITTPVVFTIAIFMIHKFAPYAAGTGIPQAIFATKNIKPQNEKIVLKVLSPLTIVFKIVTLLMVVWVGASTGREGPTVHIAAGIFMLLLWPLRKLGIKIDTRSAIVAGASAGLAAAFNTPLAGVTFAIEELMPDSSFSGIKDFVLIAIIVAGIAAQSLTGNYNYFGQLPNPATLHISAIIVVGVFGGLLGGFFSNAIIFGQEVVFKLGQVRWRKWLIPGVLSCCVLLIARFTRADVLGPGNKVAQVLLDGNFGDWSIYFPFAKIGTTLLTYWSGAAGGIFAPSLSIGASMGANIGHFMHISMESCALIGMAAFLSGAIQAPMTSFVIIFEMTGNHEMLLPIMLASVIAYLISHLLGAKHLYKALAENYNSLLIT